MQFLWDEFFQHDWSHACHERWYVGLLLFETVPGQQRFLRQGLSKVEVDRILRKERERPLSSPHAQRTFSFLKPESVKQGVVGEVLMRFERKGFLFRQLKLHQITKKEADELYAVHRTKLFFQELVDHVTSGPVLLMVLEGPNAVETVRRMVGATNPLVAEPGTIRGDFSMSITANSIHASDSMENARREASIFFREAI